MVFTVEYSTRSAMVAVDRLLGLDRQPPSEFKGQHNPPTLYQAFRALHDLD